MAHLALLRDSGGRVIRIGRSLEILQVAGNARGRRQVVVPVCMALLALYTGVRAGQRECGPRMIEGGWLPCRRRMADIALLRHAGRQVVWIGRRLKVLEMTGDAGG